MMTETERLQLERALTPRTTPYTKIELDNHRQVVFLLLLDTLEVLFGGAAGGGKSWGLLAAASQFFDVPGYSALILRRRFRDLALPGALMPISHQWWDNTDARYIRQDYQWVFPSGAVLQFGYLEHEGDELQYQSANFQFIGFDELTQFSEHQYRYLFSRLRRPEGSSELSSVPLRMRGASNPGGPGHEWVKKRFGLHSALGTTAGISTPKRKFLRSTLDDNPYLDRESYRDSLSELSDVTRAQLERGDWSAQPSGGIFNPLAAPIITADDLPERTFWKGIVRHWDLAASEPTEADMNPDWTAGLKMAKVMMPPPSILETYRKKIIDLPPPPYWIIFDIRRDRKSPEGVEEMVAGAAMRDGLIVPISIEQEKGGSGKLLIDAYRRHVVPGYKVYKMPLAGDKVARAMPIAALWNKGRVFLVDGPYIEPFLDELGLFNGDRKQHDDQVDALSGAHYQLDRLEAMTRETRITQH